MGVWTDWGRLLTPPDLALLDVGRESLLSGSRWVPLWEPHWISRETPRRPQSIIASPSPSTLAAKRRWRAAAKNSNRKKPL
jgi:hypothetical protein